MDDARARQLLEEERGRLTEIRASSALEAEDEQVVEEEAAGQHPGDVGTEVADRSLNLGILEDVERELSDVEDALRRLADGTYGRCEVCGRPIPDERLEANPTARYDVEHEQEVERAGRIAGDTTQQT